MNWHTLGEHELLARLDVNPASGLTHEEAGRRLDQYGPNTLEAQKGLSPWRLFLRQFKNPLILLLLAATAISAAIGEVFDAGLILAIVLFSAGLAFLQEYRAEKAVEALKRMLNPTAMVLRKGEEVTIPVQEIVPGDVLLLNAGDRIAADGRLHRCHALKVDEASLTGESVPVEKTPGQVDAGTPVAERGNMAFTGTVVVNGRGRALVTATGMETEFGRIARAVGEAEEEKTPLERRTAEIGKWLGAAAAAIVITVVVAGIARKAGTDEALDLGVAVELGMFGVALAVAAVPEALAGIVTGTLAVGMRRMARRNAVVRAMPAIEALGSVTVICSDKTGTITRGEMTVRRLYSANTPVEVSGVGYEPVGDFDPTDAPERLRSLLAAGALCNDAILTRGSETWSIQGDPTEGALVVLAAKAGLDVGDLRSSYERVDEVPFSSERKRMTTVHETPQGETVAFMKGAAEVVVQRCSTEVRDGTSNTLDEERRKAILEKADEMASNGVRVLAVATRTVEEPGTQIEEDMALLGLVGMIDPAREESIDAVKTCRSIGIRPVMITGDHKLTAVAIAKEVDIYRDGDTALTGAELADLSDEEFQAIVGRVSVYARVSPEDKLRIVRAWRQRGEIVAMTGDGVNDAPALKQADVGVAMGITGTEVSQEASDMVLADDNFATILVAIEMGRWIYDNIKKYLTYLLHANVVEVVVIGGIVLFKGADFLPLLPPAILYVNLVTDGLPAIALGFSPPEPDLMKRPPRSPRESVFSPDMRAFILLSLIIAPVFFWVFLRSEDVVRGRTDLFFLFLLAELVIALNLRSLRYSIFAARPHGWLWAAVVGSLAVTAGVTAVPQIREAFGVTTPNLTDLWLVGGTSMGIVILFELGKAALRRRPGTHSSGAPVRRSA